MMKQRGRLLPAYVSERGRLERGILVRVHVLNEAEPPRMSGKRGRGTRRAVRAFVA